MPVNQSDEAHPEDEDFYECDFNSPDLPNGYCGARWKSYCTGCECWRCEKHECECGREP